VAAPLCGTEDSHDFGRELRWHTTRRNADDRMAPARSVSHTVLRNTPRRSQLRRLTQSMSYRRRHWCWQQFAAVCGHPHPRCRRRHRRPRLTASDWLSLIILSEPTAWLTARRNWSRVYLALSNLCMHILIRLSFVRLTHFFARLMGKPLVILLTSD